MAQQFSVQQDPRAQLVRQAVRALRAELAQQGRPAERAQVERLVPLAPPDQLAAQVQAGLRAQQAQREQVERQAQARAFKDFRASQALMEKMG